MELPGENALAIVRYISDSGLTWTFSQKRTNAIAAGNTIVPTRSTQGPPEKWRSRYITIATVYGGELWRNRIEIGDPQNPLFTGERGTIVINGVAWIVTGRRGEYRRGPYKQFGD